MELIFEPQQDYLLIELVEEQKTIDIVLPDSVSKEDSESATFRVIAAGPGHFESGKFIEPRINVDDEIIVAGAYSIMKFHFKGKKYLLTRARDVALVVKEVK